MFHLKDGRVFRSMFRILSGFVFQLGWFLLLKHCCGAQTTGPPQPIMAMVGDDTVLPCHLEPPKDAVQMTIEWGRPDLNPRFVHVWHSGQPLETDQNSAYKGRTALSNSKMKQGDVSLKLSKSKISDNGLYRCYIPQQSKEYFVELVVGSVSSPGITLAGLDESSSGVMLQCESKGWYPEPEVLWLDGEGHVLSAGPTETVRGPDDLYTVSSRVTVDKRHGNRFTCRVQQTIINQTRETQIHVPDDFFMTPPSCTAFIVLSVLFGIAFIVTVFLFYWKFRHNQTETKGQNTDEENAIRDKLMTENKKLKDLDKKKKKLDEDFQRTKQQQKDMEQTLSSLTELMEKLKKRNEELRAEKDEAANLAGEIEKKINSVDEELNQMEGDKTVNKAKGYLKLKEICKDVNWKLEERKKGKQNLQMIAAKLMNMTIDEVHRIKERKKEADEHMEQIQQQLQETETEKQKLKEKQKADDKNVILY